MQVFLKVFRTLFFLSPAFLALLGTCQGQPKGDSLRISLITCGPGNDLYTTFGHTALRVKDYSNGGDYVFNYGTFDFSTPHFYWKFVRGRLMYFLAVENFPSFLQTYKEENREVSEQILNLTSSEKEEIWQFLKVNYQPSNRYYKYDFLFDNCSTRIRDIFSRNLGPSWDVQDIIPVKGLTFREVINSYLRNNPWEKLGINLMFGKRADQKMTNRQIMFLPYFLEQGIGHSTVESHPLVKKEQELYTPSQEPGITVPFYKHPLFWFCLGALIILIMSLTRPGKWTRAILPWVDRCLFFLTGLLGCFLLFMWFGTDHEITVWNFNILWLFPLNLIFSFYFFKNSKWIKGYATFILLLNIFLLVTWFVLPQEFPLVAIPVIVTLSVRCWRILTRSRLGYR